MTSHTPVTREEPHPLSGVVLALWLLGEDRHRAWPNRRRSSGDPGQALFVLGPGPERVGDCEAGAPKLRRPVLAGRG